MNPKTRRNLFSVATIAGAAAMQFAGAAHAVPQGAFWVEIPVIDHPDDATDMTGYRCFGLYVQLEPGDVLYAADFGVAGPNVGLTTTQTVFEHPAGIHVIRSDSLIGILPDLFYDTFLTMGGLDGASDEISVQNLDFSDTADMTAVWNVNFAGAGLNEAPAGVGPGATDDGTTFWIAQITVTSAGDYLEPTGFSEFLGGEMFLQGEGPGGEFGQIVTATGVVSIPNFQPLGGGSLFGTFDMLSPACGAQHVPVHHTELAWESHPDAFEYQVVVTSDFRLLDTVHVANFIPSSAYAIPAGVLEPCTTYYWYARAHDGIDAWKLASNWQLCSFTTGHAGDLNSDGAVDTADLGQMIGVFQSDDPVSDLNGDGVVDTADLGMLIANFGGSCD